MSPSVASAAIEQTYRYLAPSALTTEPSGARLALATSGGSVPNPRLFRGAIRRPEVIADAMLAVASVARSRFYTPPAMLHRILLAADPIVTCADGRIRFESLSACCGVYARLDLLGGALDGEILGRGTTNVDFGTEMRAALAGAGAGTLWLGIGLDEVEVRAGGDRAVERRVPLPARWVRALTELAAIQDGMTDRFDVARGDAVSLLRALARAAGTKEAWLVSAGRGVRVAHHAAAGSIRVGGPQRLRAVERMTPHLTGLRVHASDDGSSAWRLELPDARLTLVLSPDAWRGLSGEGRLLSSLAAAPTPAALVAVRAQLRWQPILTVADLEGSTGLGPTDIRAALATLAAAGLLGVDLADGGYFHRELPFDLETTDRRQPRLRDARRILAADGVRVETTGDEELVAWVAGSGVEHRVRVTANGATCTCPWFGRHRGARGPCKHVLAVQLATMEQGDAEQADDVALA